MKSHTIHVESRGTYGAPRVHAEPAAQGIHVGSPRVARLMRAAAVQGVSRRKQIVTRRDREARPAPDLDMAIVQRLPRALIHHSDQSSQDTAIAYGQRCREFGIRPSMGSAGDAYNHVMCESLLYVAVVGIAAS